MGELTSKTITGAGNQHFPAPYTKGYMGKVYEFGDCTKEKNEKVRYNIPLDTGGSIEFTPSRDKVTGEYFGVFDSDSPNIQAACTREIVKNDKVVGTRDSTAAELEAEVEKLPVYKEYIKARDLAVKNNRPITFRGIWPQKDRLDDLRKKVGVSTQQGSAYARLSDTELKALIELKKGACPANASHDKLVQIVEDLAVKES